MLERLVWMIKTGLNIHFLNKDMPMKLENIWMVDGKSSEFAKKSKTFILWFLVYFFTITLMLVIDKYLLPFCKDSDPDFVFLAEGVFGFFVFVGGLVIIFKLSCLIKLVLMSSCGQTECADPHAAQKQPQNGSLMVLFGQRKCNYDGEFAVEALECMDGFGYSENPDYLAGKLTEYEESGEFDRLAILPLSLDYDEITKRLYPESGNAILVAGIAC